MALYKSLKAAWRRCPQPARELVFKTAALRNLRVAVRETLARFAPHEEVYDREYYSWLDAASSAGATAMARGIDSAFRPRSVIDIGCGTGALLAAFRELGVEARGFDYSATAIECCLARGIAAQRLNLEADALPELPRADVAVSFEVGEHLPARFADRYIAWLAELAPCLAFSAATPGQGGDNHVNEQPHEYWIGKIEHTGLRLLAEETKALRAAWREEGVAAEYARNLLLFRRAELPRGMKPVDTENRG